MAKKTETVYAPFSFTLVDMMYKKPVHEGHDGRLMVFKNPAEAYEKWDELKQNQGAQLSAFGCGSDGMQHVYLPTCTGIIRMEVPKGLLPDDRCTCIISDKTPVGSNDIKINSDWISQVDIRIEGDVAHSSVIYTQLTGGGAPDYDKLPMLAQYRFEDLERICGKLAREKSESREQTNLYEERARDSLREMYCGNGFAHKRFFIRNNMTEEQQRLTSGLEYLQPYMHAMDKVLGIDSILRHAHSMEQEFRDMYPQHDNHTSDARIAAAATVAKMMQEHAERSVTKFERTAFLSFKANAEQDIELFQKETATYNNTGHAPAKTHEAMVCETEAPDGR